MSALLGVDRLSVVYKSGSPALQNVSFAMNAGRLSESWARAEVVNQRCFELCSACFQTAGSMPGRHCFQGKSIFSLSQKEWGSIRGKRMAMVFQDSGSYLNPIRTIGSQYIEAIRTHVELSKKAAYAMAMDMLSQMGLGDPERMMSMYPAQLSGGMKQRTAIAMAITMKPELLLADEPTSALDVTTQVEVIKRLTNLRASQGTGMIIVTHNIAVAAHMADYIGVMQNGLLVEFGQTSSIITSPRHAYTRGLLAAVPELEGIRMIDERIPVLEMRNLSKTYESRGQGVHAALQSINLKLYPGECLGIVGESGSGKSTLAKCVTHLEKATSGQIIYRQQDITWIRGEALRQQRKQIQMVFRNLRQFSIPA